MDIVSENLQAIITYYGSFMVVLAALMSFIKKMFFSAPVTDPEALKKRALWLSVIGALCSVAVSFYATISIQWDWVLFLVGAVVLFFMQAGLSLAGVKPLLNMFTKGKKITPLSDDAKKRR